ncbi:MAG: ABC transporter permease [Anaerolineae bacterium]
MATQIIRRLLWLPILLISVTIITLGLARYGPGDPVQVMLGPRAQQDAAQALREQLGLDDPFPVYVAKYLANAVRGDFGESYRYRGQPVGPLIWERIKVSAQIGVTALLIGTFLGVTLGIFAALARNTWLDHTIIGSVVLVDSIPVIALALPLLYLLAVRWRVVPAGGWNGLLSASAVLPILLLALGPLAVFARQTRANLLEVINQDYIRTARAKGLGPTRVVTGHALRSALIPLTTLFGLAFAGSLIGGAFFVETILGIPGVGQLGYETLRSRDYPVIMALVILTAVIIAIANLVVDIAYTYLDPRTRST